jgi:serine/threonine-protein kinase RIM15
MRIPSGLERSSSQDIRVEREELREAAERTLNTIVDLNLDCTIKWTSPSWTDVVGTSPESVQGCPISDLIVSDNKTVFKDVIQSMRRDDSRSHRVKFAITLGPMSKLLTTEDNQPTRIADAGNDHDHRGRDGEKDEGGKACDLGDPPAPDSEMAAAVIDIEAQGIVVYDSASGGESHVSPQALWNYLPHCR